MRTTLTILLTLAVWTPSCRPPAGVPAGNRPEMGSKDRYTVNGMTDAVVEIEAALGSKRIDALQARYNDEYRADPKQPFNRFLWAYSITDRNEACSELTKITKLNDKFYWTYIGMGIIQTGWGVYDQAENNFERAIELGPKIAIAFGRFGKMWLAKGDFAQAIKMLEKAVDRDPGTAGYRLDLARALEKSGQAQPALAQYRMVIEKKPELFIAQREMAELLLHKGDKPEALAAYTRAVEIDPEAYDVQHARASLLDQLGKSDEALAAYTKACGHAGVHLDCWRSMAALADRLGKQDQRKGAYESIMQDVPDDLEACKVLAPLYLESGEIEKALPTFQVVRKKEPHNLQALVGLATIFDKGGEFSKAIELTEQIMAADEKNEKAREIRDRLFDRFQILKERIAGKSPSRVFALNRKQIAKVYKERLKKKPKLKGDMLIKVTVSNEGEVSGVTMAKNTIGDQLLDICALWNLRRSVFPKGFGATYDFQLTLKPGE